MRQGNNNQFLLPLSEGAIVSARCDVVLSIKPAYSEKILDGRKTVELRRRFPVRIPNFTLAYIYSTSPVKAMVGAALIRDVFKLPVEQIWTEFGGMACIEREQFEKYFNGIDHGFVLVFDGVKTFSCPMSLGELREKFGFEPPQSFCYTKRDLQNALQDEVSPISH